LSTAGRSRKRANRRGRNAEIRAALFLRLKGYRILARNYRCRAGELDIVAQRRATIAFVEVKTRHSRAAALEAVNAHGRRRIIAAAAHWRGRFRQSDDCTFRFDVVVMDRWGWPSHLVSAFEESA
jgi:putative endonuclease